ncbi:MAG: hypothetical protein KDD58_07415 [Bdellovibrionales bacterium]|nr:hypothetical protein [Bdellovibrionales bacterium]
MKTIFKFFILYLVFTVNIQIKAQIISEPRNCWQKEGECGVKSLHRAESLSLIHGQVDFASDSIWKRSSDESIRLIKGYFLVSAEAVMNVQTKYITVTLKPKQKLFVNIGFDRVEVVAFQGDLELQDLLYNKYVLPQAYTNWFGKIDSNKNIEVGFPRPANFKELIAQLGAISSMKKSELHQSLKSFKDSWTKAIDETQDRSIASSNRIIEEWRENLKYQAERRRLRAIERRKMREFFYNKTFRE